MKRGTDRAWIEIDPSAIRDNLLAVKALHRPGMRFCAVVKTDGYGHGAVEAAKALEGLSDMLAVATPEEAEDLRNAGIREPILILSPVHESRFPELIEREIRPTLFTASQAEAFSKAAESLRKEGFFHIKVDTGMNRIGLRPDPEGLETVRRMTALPFVRAEGIFTHLATADMEDPAAAKDQLRRFRAFLTALREQGITFPLVHGDSSAASMRFRDEDFDMCRLGICLYGLEPSHEVRWPVALRPALSLYARVVAVKTVPAGEGIGYGGTSVSDRDRVIATIPVGYGDGYPRALSNKGEVLIHGKRVKIAGRICMDQIMADVTPLYEAGEEVLPYDVVTLIGTDGAERITLEELSDLSGRFNYEFACCLRGRLPRLLKTPENGAFS